MAVDPFHTKAAPRSRFRWVICLLLFLVTVNNYMDRQVFSVAAPVITAEYHLSNSDIAAITNAFLAAYTFGQLFGGVFVDWIGARKGLSLAVIAWSLTGALTGLARRVVSFGTFRLLLGLSEAVNQPAGVKVAAEWFPPNELATAVGLLQSGSSVGAMIAPPVAAYLIIHFGWRAAFLLVAIPGLLWVPIWLALYRPGEQNPKADAAERRIPWYTFLRHRAVWGVAAARFLEEPAGWFYFTWLPLYLKDQRAVSLLDTGLLLTIPFLTFDIGKVGGGWISSQLMRIGWPLDRARKAVMLLSAVALMASIPAVTAHSPLGFIWLIGVATFGHGCWATTVQTLPGDLVAPRWVGTVYGITAFGGGAGSMMFMYATGRLADAQHSFQTPFVVAGVLPMIGYVVFLLLAGKIRPLQVTES